MKRLTVFAASAAMALLPLSSARASPTGQPLGCGPAADVAEPTGLALVDDGKAAEAAAPVATIEEPVPVQDHEVHFSDHDLMIVLATAAVVILLIILF